VLRDDRRRRRLLEAQSNAVADAVDVVLGQAVTGTLPSSPSNSGHAGMTL
jgi:hypothetical protein